MMDWLRDMLGLPERSSRRHPGQRHQRHPARLLTARERATGWQANEKGWPRWARRPQLTVYCSEEAHSSIEKTMKVAGYGRKPAQSSGPTTTSPCARGLGEAIEADIARGLDPGLRHRLLGGTGTGAIDPLRAIGEICRRKASGFMSMPPGPAAPDPARDARHARRHRACRQLRLQPAQVAVHQLRLHRLFRARPARRWSAPWRWCRNI